MIEKWSFHHTIPDNETPNKPLTWVRRTCSWLGLLFTVTYISTTFVVVIVRVNVGCISSFDGKKTLVFKLSVCPDILLSSGRHLSPSIIHLLVAGSSLSEYVHVVHVAEFQWIWCFVCKWCSVMGLLATIFPVTC